MVSPPTGKTSWSSNTVKADSSERLNFEEIVTFRPDFCRPPPLCDPICFAEVMSDEAEPVKVVSALNRRRKTQDSGWIGRFGGVLGVRGASRATSWCFAAVLNAWFSSTTISIDSRTCLAHGISTNGHDFMVVEHGQNRLQTAQFRINHDFPTRFLSTAVTL